MNCLFPSVVLALAIAGTPVCAQAKLDVRTMKTFGGTYQAECANASTGKTFKGYALTELSAPGLLYDPKAKAAYHKALGPLSKEPWLAKLDGPSPQNKAVKVAGVEYVLLSACKNHDCAENNTVLLYSATGEVYGKVYQRGRSTLIGAPPPAVATELDGLWKKEWRSQPK